MPSLTDINQTTAPGIGTALAVMDIGIRVIGTGDHDARKCETLFTAGDTKPLSLFWKYIACGIGYRDQQRTSHNRAAILCPVGNLQAAKTMGDQNDVWPGLSDGSF